MKKIFISMGLVTLLVSTVTTTALAQEAQNSVDKNESIESMLAMENRAAIGRNRNFSDADGGGKPYRGDFHVKYRTGSNLGVVQSTESGKNVVVHYQYETVSGTKVGRDDLEFRGKLNGFYTPVQIINPAEYQIRITNKGDKLSKNCNFWFHINS